MQSVNELYKENDDLKREITELKKKLEELQRKNDDLIKAKLVNYYRIDELADDLNISTTTVGELKKKMKIKKVTDIERKEMKAHVKEIKKKYKYVTLSTVCSYFRERKAK